MAEPTFVLDANIFIEAKRRYYAFDLVPGFWTSLIGQASNGRIESIDRVKQELVRGKDELAAWANDEGSELFAATDEEQIFQRYADIMTWVDDQDQLFPEGKSEFADGADGWLIAYAKVKNSVVVTHEQFNLAVRRKVLIPNVCQVFNVRFVDTFDMLRSLGVRL